MTKLSKRAFSIGKELGFEQNSQIREYIDTIWVPSKGFFENLFKIGLYVSPFIGGGAGRFIPIILGSLGSFLLGLGPGELGRALDGVFGTGPGVAPPPDVENKIEKLLESAINSKMQELRSSAHPISRRQIEKTAGIFSMLLRSGKVASMVASFIGKLILAIPGIYGLATIDDFIKKKTSPVRKMMTGKPEGFIEEDIGREINMSGNKKPNLNTFLEDLEQKYGISQTEE